MQSFLKFFLLSRFFSPKIQFLVQSIGLYAALMDKKELIKLVGSGILMAGFAFINYLLMLLFTTFRQNAIVLNCVIFRFNSLHFDVFDCNPIDIVFISFKYRENSSRFLCQTTGFFRK